LGNCPFNPPQVCTFRHTHPCYSRHITFHFLILTVRIYSICLLYVFIVCCVLYVFTETQTVLYCVPTLNFLHIGNNYIIHVTPCTFLLLFLFPSLASSFFTPTPAHYVYMNMYMSPSPLCVLLTQCCDDVHSAGGGGRCCSGAGWDTTDAGWDTTARAGTLLRGLGHYCAGWDTTARAGTLLRGLGHRHLLTLSTQHNTIVLA
jgi:hypothetical protein